MIVAVRARDRFVPSQAGWWSQCLPDRLPEAVTSAPKLSSIVERGGLRAAQIVLPHLHVVEGPHDLAQRAGVACVLGDEALPASFVSGSSHDCVVVARWIVPIEAS